MVAVFGTISLVYMTVYFYRYMKKFIFDNKNGEDKKAASSVTRVATNTVFLYYMIIIFQVLRMGFRPYNVVKCNIAMSIFFFLESSMFCTSAVLANKIYDAICNPMEKDRSNIYVIGRISQLNMTRIAVCCFSLAIVMITVVFGDVYPSGE